MIKLFDPNGNDDSSSIKMVYGQPTGIFNLNIQKYSWSSNLYRLMTGNFWLPEKVSMNQDKTQYKLLTDEEKRSYKGIVSFLTFLDSIQTTNLPHISDYITAPEVKILLAIQTYQEAIHSQSYAVLLESVIPADERESVYNFWKDHKILQDRNQYIVNFYEEFINQPTVFTLAKVIIANYILEGLYFYNGFSFFFNLEAQGKMVGTGSMIRYIRRDEATHCKLFCNIVKEIQKEDKTVSLLIKKSIYSMFEEAVDQEIKWSNYIIPNNEMNNESYTKWLADCRLSDLGFEKLYNVNKPNTYSDFVNSDSDTKTNFFEATVTAYNQSSNVDGWDDI